MQSLWVSMLYAARLSDTEYVNKVVRYINSRVPKKRLPFRIYMDTESSTPSSIVLRVEHRTGGTSNRVVITVKVTVKDVRKNLQLLKHRFHVDASNGSNWHHLKFDFTVWLKSILDDRVPPMLEYVAA